MKDTIHVRERQKYISIKAGTFFVLIVVLLSNDSIDFILPVEATTVTTTIAISICGDAIINPGEVCDDGLFNDGAYASSTAARRCNTTCSGYGPYCGDGILQALYLEGCDDGNNTSGDLCSASCTQESSPVSTTTPPAPPPPPPPGGSGGPGVFTGNVPVRAKTRVNLLGKAYPGATVNILKDGQAIGIASADQDANFSYETADITPGPTTFGFWALDSKGLRSITYTTTFQVTQNAVTTVSNIFLPPTINLDEKKVLLGDELHAFGSTAPLARVTLYVDKEKEPRASATSTPTGAWEAAFLSSGLANEAFHAVRAMFESIGTGPQAKSGLSQAINFYVGQQDRVPPGSADLNGDGRVNLVDFSILLFHWGTDHGVADLNSDGKVNLTDFSILLFNWTG